MALLEKQLIFNYHCHAQNKTLSIFLTDQNVGKCFFKCNYLSTSLLTVVQLPSIDYNYSAFAFSILNILKSLKDIVLIVTGRKKQYKLQEPVVRKLHKNRNGQEELITVTIETFV